MEESSAEGIPLDKSKLRVEEHVEGCTIYWKRPAIFDTLSPDQYRQQVVVKEGLSVCPCVHTLITPPVSLICIPTEDAQIYNVQITIISNDSPEELFSRGVIRFAAFKKKALENRRRPKILPIDLHAKVSALSCKVEWPESVLDRPGNLKLRLCSNGVWNPVRPRPDFPCFEILTVPGRNYFFEFRKYINGIKLSLAGDVWFKATYSPKEMNQLYDKAVSAYEIFSLRKFRIFYRCKPSSYFENIQSDHAGIMKTYLKDLTGHPASPINHRLNGLFFHCRLRTNGDFPHFSPFGNSRWFIEADILFDPRRDNIYFADYYCTYSTHYVIIVIATKNSEQDEFCFQRLVQLDPYDNSFLTARWNNRYKSFEYFCNMDLWVEIFYTEDLPLSMGVFTKVEPVFRGKSTVLGLPNNKSCKKCNLYPQTEENDDLRVFADPDFRERMNRVENVEAFE
ncbi:hypothetical protein FO519_001319 [Halicephalobus sp. NKZ332]|nr:hypothetical protein FO519_001319 [Halicephalobus sp. NKZ332]